MSDDGARYGSTWFSGNAGQDRNEEALRQERDFISTVLDTASALVVVLTPQGQIVRFNKACERTTRYSFDEVRGKPFWDVLLVADEIEPVKAVFEQLRAGQFPSEYENTWLTKTGGRRLIAWSNTVILGADGAVEYVIGTGIDITERRQAEAERDTTLEALRQARDELETRVAERTIELRRAARILEEEIAERKSAEEALRQTEGHMRSLMDSARNYGVYRVAVDPTHPYLARVILASPSLKELLSIGDLYDFSSWFANIHPGDLDRIVKANRRSLETDLPFDQQFRILKEERGDWDWVHVRSTPVPTSVGRLTHFNGLVVDITEQKHAEEEIRRQNDLLAALHETALGIVSRLNVDELLEAILERALKLVGATYGFIYLVRPGEDEIEIRVTSKSYREFAGLRLKRGEGLAGKVFQSGQPLAVEDYDGWSGRSPQFEGGSFGPALGTPLMSGAEVAGVLGIGRPPSAPPFRQDEIDLLHRFSHLASIALDNARLYTSAQEELVERMRTERTLQAVVEFEDAIARISGSFINLLPEQVDEGIQRALQTIGEFYHVERTYVFQFSGDGMRMDCTHEWCSEGVEPQIQKLKNLPADRFRWTVGQIRRSEVVQIRDASQLPPEAQAERAEFRSIGLKSRIVVPMVYHGIPVGFVGLDTTQARLWTEQSLKLQVIGDIFVNALEHRRSQAIEEGQRQFLELLATGQDFDETLHTLVRLIEDQWPGMLGLILLLDEDGKHLHIGASMSLPKDYVQSIEGLEIGPMVGSCGTACYRRERVIVEDTATDPRWEGLRDLALRYDLRACWSEPVFSPDGQVVGTFAMYYRQPRAPTDAELRAIEMGAHLVGVAVEHERAQRALQQSEEKFRGIVEYANVGIAIVQDAHFRFVNSHYAAMLGYTAEEMVGTDFMRHCTPDERDRIVDLYTRRARGEPAPTRYETAMVHKNGGRVYAEVSAGIIPYGNQQATFVFLRDITEEKQAKQALAEAYQTLEQRVEERTEELAVLNSIAAVVSGSLDLKEIMRAALDKTCEALSMEFGTAYSLKGKAVQVTALDLDKPDVVGREAVAQVMQAPQAPPGQTSDYGQLALLAHCGLSAQYADLVGDMQLPSAVAALARLGRPFVWLVEDTVPAGTALKESLEREGCRQVVTLPLIAKGNIVGALNLGTRTPRAFTPEQLSLLAAIGQQVGVAIDNARLYEAEQGRREEAERRRRVAEGLREILATLNSDRPLGEILSYIAAQASHLLGSDAAALCRLDKQSQFLTIQASHGLDIEFTEHMAFQVGPASIVGEAVFTRSPTTTSNLADWMSRAPVPEGSRELARRFAALYRTVLSVPMLQKEEAYGALALYYKAERQFTEEEVNLAVTFADQAALAIENARLREQAEQAAAMEERGRLARELHDSVTQSLYSVTMYAEAAARLVPSSQEVAAGYLRDARDTAQEALREMRLLIYQLRPPALEQGGLAVALQVRLDAVERRGGIKAELTVEGEDRLPPAIQAELHQIAHEALNNALKHAHAQQVQVRLAFGEAETYLQVQDDGLGFDPAAVQGGGGLGLPGMQERAQKIGGRLEITSAPGRGTKVVVEVPNGGEK